MATSNTLRGMRDSKHDDDEASLEISAPFDTEAFSAELQRLAATNKELVGGGRSDDVAIGQLEEELELFRMENTELHARIGELEQANSELYSRVGELENLLQLAGGGEEMWLERQQEYEKLLEEKSEVIRTLHLRLQEQPASSGAGSSSNSGMLSGGQAEEILRLKRELEEHRRQLQEDEEAMMLQMRQMEMAMARDRAEMARQRSEIKRMQDEHERGVDKASRDPQLQERLHNMRRPETQAKLSRPGLPAVGSPNTPAKETPPASAPGDGVKNSGILRRIFG
jgi:hypothetical protein